MCNIIIKGTIIIESYRKEVFVVVCVSVAVLPIEVILFDKKSIVDWIILLFQWIKIRDGREGFVLQQ